MTTSVSPLYVYLNPLANIDDTGVYSVAADSPHLSYTTSRDTLLTYNDHCIPRTALPNAAFPVVLNYIVGEPAIVQVIDADYFEDGVICATKSILATAEIATVPLNPTSSPIQFDGVDTLTIYTEDNADEESYTIDIVA